MRSATGPRATIMVVDDDQTFSEMLSDVLDARSYRVRTAGSAAVAKSILEEDFPDLIILDLMLPDTDGLVLCADLHARAGVPIIICSASHRKSDAILGLKLGADDFVAKPFDVDELDGRIAAVLRRVGRERSLGALPPAAVAPPFEERRVERVGDLVIDYAQHQVTWCGQVVRLTATEYRLLSALASRPDQVLSRQQLAHLAGGAPGVQYSRAIDTHLSRLRAKLKAVGKAPPIVSVLGTGYKYALTLDGAIVSAA